MIFHAMITKEGDKLLVKCSDGAHRDINDTAYVLVGVYSTLTYNGTMKQFTSTLHGIFDDSRLRTLNVVSFVKCENCNVMANDVDILHSIHDVMICSNFKVKIVRFYDIPTIG